MWFPSLAWEDPLEEELATHSSILARRIPRTEEPGKLQSIELQRVGHDRVHTYSDQISGLLRSVSQVLFCSFLLLSFLLKSAHFS